MGLKFHLTCPEKVFVRGIKDSQKKKMAKEKIYLQDMKFSRENKLFS